MFFVPTPASVGPIRPSAGVTFAVMACLVMTLVIGLNAGPFILLANQAAAAVLPAGAEAAVEALVRP
jgi:hypothetical protein